MFQDQNNDKPKVKVKVEKKSPEGRAKRLPQVEVLFKKRSKI
jgi:hypothetical protein